MICPNLKCGHTVVAPDSARGKVVRCAYCQQLFLVPTHHPNEPQPTAQSAPEADKPNPRG